MGDPRLDFDRPRIRASHIKKSRETKGPAVHGVQDPQLGVGKLLEFRVRIVEGDSVPIRRRCIHN